jgi:flavin reductase (DIM6/NTAB) family NADH-FMN oxidoreductase RutF
VILQPPLKHARFSAIYLELMTTYEALSSADESEFQTLEPKILYFGTPVALISSVNPDGTPNLAPMSSFWALGWTLVLGISLESQTIENLRQRPDCVVNLPSPDLWRHVERLAPLTGRNPVPGDKESRFRFERDKFGASGLTPLASEGVSAPRVKECPAQLEARVKRIHPLAGDPRLQDAGGAAAVEVEIVRVHLARRFVLDGNYVNPRSWQPLIYNFRHYFGLGQELGKTFRAET